MEEGRRGALDAEGLSVGEVLGCPLRRRRVGDGGFLRAGAGVLGASDLQVWGAPPGPVHGLG